MAGNYFPLSTFWLHLVRQLVYPWVMKWWMFLFTRKAQVIWYWLELCHPSSLWVVSKLRPRPFGFLWRLLKAGSSYWKLIQLNRLGNYLQRVYRELHLNIWVRKLWVCKFIKLIESIFERESRDWVSDGISEYKFSIFFSVWVQHGYV